MHEIEVKAKVVDQDKLLAKLERDGCQLGPAVAQDDTVYSNMPKIPGTAQPDRVVLRVRIEDGRVIFTLKKDRANELSGEEHETEVSDEAELRAIIKLLKFTEVVRVRKERQQGEWRGCHVCVDRVDGLGDFIELEKLTDEEKDLEIQDELAALLAELGAGERVTKGYDTLVLERRLQGLE